MSVQIHPTSIIEDGAKLGKNIKIGPFCIIDSNVEIGDNSILKSHITIQGNTKIGSNNIIYPFASIGHPPQDLKYKGENSSVDIGNNNIIREYVTVQPGTEGGGMITKVGNECLLMVGVHIAHDCKISDRVILANYVSLAGHVEVGYCARIGGLAAVAQHVRVGPYAMIGGLSGLSQDLIPFGLASNERANLEGINLVGMKREGFDQKESLEAVKAVNEILDNNGVLAGKIETASKKYGNNLIVKTVIEFILSNPARAFCHFKKK
jgi:UDP-N-acetylglucosamine acyltransferase